MLAPGHTFLVEAEVAATVVLAAAAQSTQPETLNEEQRLERELKSWISLERKIVCKYKYNTTKC